MKSILLEGIAVQFPRGVRRRCVMLCAFVLCLLGSLISIPEAQALVIEPMTLTKSNTVYGDFILVGNGVLTCTGVKSSNCGRLFSGDRSVKNDTMIMYDVDVDSSSTTRNSSQARITVPAGALVVSAKLLWSANTGYAKGSGLTTCNALQTATLPPGSPDSSQPIISVAGNQMAAPVQNYRSDSGSAALATSQPYYYSADSDVTSVFTGIPTGSQQIVTVGNVWAPNGYGCYGGWALELVYDFGQQISGNAQSAPREVYSFDGYEREFSRVAPATVTLNGLQPEGSGARMGAIAYEGEAAVEGDEANYSDETTSRTGLTSPGYGEGGNYFEGYADGAVPYRLAYDGEDGWIWINASVSAAPQPLSNLVSGDSNLTIEFDTEDDSYLLQNVIISVPVAVPVPVAAVEIFKTAPNGDTTQVLLPGEIPSYKITIHNSGEFGLTDLRVDDPAVLACSRAVGTIPDIPIGGSYDYTCSGLPTTVNGEGEYVNTATVHAISDGTEPASVSDDSLATAQFADIEVAKATREATFATGTAPSWTITVTNEGTAPLLNVQVSDPGAPNCVRSFALIQPGDVQTYECLGVAATSTVTNTVSVTAEAHSANGPVRPVVETASGGPTNPQDEFANNTATVQVTDATIAKTTEGGENGHVAPGGAVTYTIQSDVDTGQVVNTATVTGSDPNGDDISANATRAVTQADLDEGARSNTASVSASTPVGGEVDDTGSTTVQSIGSPDISISKTANLEEYSTVGQVIDYTIIASNEGNVTLSNVLVSDSQPHLSVLTCDKAEPVDLAPGEDQTCTASLTVTQADLDAGFVVNDARVESDGPDGDALPIQADSVRLRAVRTLDLDLTKTANPTTVSQVGQVVTYTFTSTNLGNTTLSSVLIADPLAGLSSLDCGTMTGPVALAPGETKTCTATRSTTQADLDTGQVSNTATVRARVASIVQTGTRPRWVNLERTAQAQVSVTQPPALAVSKSSDVASVSQPGQHVGYSFLVTNTGNVTIRDILIDDPLPGIFNRRCDEQEPGERPTLVPGESVTCYADYITTQADLDAAVDIVNTVTVSATDPDGTTVTGADDDSVVVETAPAVGLTKTATVTDGSLDQVGDEVSYRIVATNEGNQTLSDVLVADPLLADLSCNWNDPDVPVLAPGDSVSCNGSLAATQAQLDNGTLDNTASLSSRTPMTDGDGNPILATTTAEASVPVVVNADLAVSVVPDVDVVGALGQRIVWTLRVSNTGNVTLHNVSLVNSLLEGAMLTTPDGQQVSAQDLGSISPGQSLVFTFEQVVSQQDLDAGTIMDRVVASGTATGGEVTRPSVEDQAVVEVTQVVAITFIKSVELDDRNANGDAEVGEVLRYRLTAINDGTVSASDVQISDPMIGLSTLNCMTPNGSTLAPGAKLDCVASYRITQADADRGRIANTAMMSSELTDPVNATVEIPVKPAPAQLLADTGGPLGVRPGLAVLLSVLAITVGISFLRHPKRK